MNMDSYARFHQDRVNLLIHIVMVPVFVLGVLGAVWSAWRANWLTALLLGAAPLISLAVQGYGHKREANPPLPFSGPGDFVLRVFREQFYTFPMFVLTGAWRRCWRQSGPHLG